MSNLSLLAKMKQWWRPEKNVLSRDFQLKPTTVVADLFSDEQLERFGATLAENHQIVTQSKKGGLLLKRLADCERRLSAAFDILSDYAQSSHHLMPAEEWFLDNFYLMQEQIYIIKQNIPKHYEKELPTLDNGFPRIYDIALQILEHRDGRWDDVNLARFIQSYQKSIPLTLGELWALPVMLRLALIEMLKDVSCKVATTRRSYNLADFWADQMIDVAISDQQKLVITIADMVRAEPPMIPSFVAELTRRLQNAELALPLSWIEQKLLEEGLTIDQLVQSEINQQANDQLTISNCISSIRRLNEVDWHDFVEEMSVVEQKLREDPTHTYPHMDFETRDRYRHVVEKEAHSSQQSEMTVAEKAIYLANQNNCHVGFFLIGNRLHELRRLIGAKDSIRQIISNWFSKYALFTYLFFYFLMILIATDFIINEVSKTGVHYLWLPLLTILILLCLSESVQSIENYIITLFVAPKPLPKMDFSKGIPMDLRTLITVPVLLTDIDEIESIVEALEIRFLGNRDNHLYFALLTDFSDAHVAQLPDDDALIQFTKKKIEDLNQRYKREGETIFFLLHRPREWNPQEEVWMGHERKRGKLNDLNALLRDQENHFTVLVGDLKILKQIRYVITLDCDTQLPRETAHELIGAMAHPLNRPHYDIEKNRVVSGYGILQPRLGEALAEGNITYYNKLFGTEFGIDPYTRAVSNVYQDFFSEGSYNGKGIYDVDIFHQVLWHRFPDNLILSHDLLEGCYLRSGFISDVTVYENSPSDYISDVKRRSRWIRGDWQLIDWLAPWVRCYDNRFVKNPLSSLAKWKLFDNLRRSCVAGSQLLLLIIGLFLGMPFFWIGFILITLLVPFLIPSLVGLFKLSREVTFTQHLMESLQQLKKHFLQMLFYLACLPFGAWYSLKAIFFTCWRLKFSHRHLLEWKASHQIAKADNKLSTWYRFMLASPLIALICGSLLLIWQNQEVFLVAFPLLLLWFFSPLIARWVSQPIGQKEQILSQEQNNFLRLMARLTWNYFETFVGEEGNWLPPDNFQEEPKEILSHRTSPTNIGLGLLSNLTAYDFGYITVKQLLDRTEKTFTSMAKLERYRGHFYNWYDTKTLKPLYPRYISTVDGGNLAGHLLTLRQGLISLLDEPLLKSQFFDGLEDTFFMLDRDLKFDTKTKVTFEQLIQTAKTFIVGKSVKDLLEHLNKLMTFAKQLPNAEKLYTQCAALHDEFASLPDLTLETNTPLKNLPGYESTQALIKKLADIAFDYSQMDMLFLYNETSRLMTIGFDVEKQLRDRSDYDLLSSEARLANFVAIAQCQVPQESWFALGRLQVMTNQGEPLMLSWSGSMFEYLMPMLVMPSYTGTLLDQACKAAVNQQIAYGEQRGVPWGISESGFHAIDAHSNYLYRAFGIPELGLKRGLSDDLVIAPYATVMALMVAPEAACLNLQRMAKEGVVGRYGFYEAIDFTRSRLPGNKHHVIVRSFMVHHQAMSLLAYSYVLHNKPMQRRFTADPLFQSTLLLLQERIPKPRSHYFQLPAKPHVQPPIDYVETTKRVFTHPNTNTPQVQLLSNGRYHVMVSQAGGGYSQWKNLALTRWREDVVSDRYGFFTYIADVKTKYFWSTSYQPTTGTSDYFRAIFSEGHAEFIRREDNIEVYNEIVVSAEDDIELRRFRIHNFANRARTIEFTTYAEVVLAPSMDDQSAPAFSNLFVETEVLKDRGAIIVKRRPRDPSKPMPLMFHMLVLHRENNYPLSFESNRDNFVGRTQLLSYPIAMQTPGPLSNTAGIVLDPIVAIRCRIDMLPNDAVTIDVFNGVAESHEQCLALVEKYHDRSLANRVFELSWTHNQVLLHQLNISEIDTKLYSRLAAAIIYGSVSYRGDANYIVENRAGQARLWGYAISGDLPIVLLHIESVANIEIVRQLTLAQAYWRRKGLMVDLVILNEEGTSYRQLLQEQITNLINTMYATEDHGNIYLRVADQMPREDRVLLESIARVVLSDKRGSLKEQLNRRHPIPTAMKKLEPIMPAISSPQSLTSNEKLQFFNGYGGFNNAGNEYHILLGNDKVTPAPWVNVLANPQFGTLVSESGQGSTWFENAHEFRLTPWNNDPVEDYSGEALYIRDDETGEYWSPCPLPCRGKGDYRIRHGFGYSIFEHTENGIYSELTMYVANNAAVKFMVLKIQNNAKRLRYLSAFGYVEWVLGDLRSKNAMHILTDVTDDGAILANNYYNSDFGNRTAFFSAYTQRTDLIARTYTASRAEFVGRNRTNKNPAALETIRLSGRVGARLDPCAALQFAFDLGPGSSRKIIFILGAGQDHHDALQLIDKYNNPIGAGEAYKLTLAHWSHLLSQVHVTTPDPALNLLANGWLVYQTIACRLWARNAFYQSSGAFGFRDQLQDVMAIVHTAPELYRAQLILCASRQFKEGDVQHWWHMPSGRGVRTRCSDDYLWLPFALCRYIQTTDDMSILDEQIHFLEGRALKPEEAEYYDLPTVSTEIGDLYEHAVRAILHGLRFGEHGLPLMGSCDWNDGMNLVGIGGKGESVWLGFFLYDILRQFSELAKRKKDDEFAKRCESEADILQKNLEKHAWDGQWYKRAYFDDGTPLGSANDSECRIDSIAQSWAVISKAADPSRMQQAMQAVNQYLVRPSDGVVALLDPPFHSFVPNPGYIQSYVRGIRENGGQYTHAATWVAIAFQELNKSEMAWEILNIINPINHGSTHAEINRYKIEPYVVAGDVYSVTPHIGRGGWSWYTGSAGWMYRLILESLLGLHLHAGKQLFLRPNLPKEWKDVFIEYRHGERIYKITLNQTEILVNNNPLKEHVIDFQDL